MSAATVTASASAIGGADIARVLGSTGPIVKAVLLKAGPEPITEEITLDTTPSKQMAQEILGGPMTFLGQYEDEGIVLMIRKRNVLDEDDEEEEDDDEELFIRDEARAQLADLKISQLRKLCAGYDLDSSKCVERGDLVDLILDDMEKTMQSLPPNRHALQPPLRRAKVRGDILVLKVARTQEALDEIDITVKNDAAAIQQAMAAAAPLSNEEFFLDYTKDECLSFLARTDIDDFELPVTNAVSSNEEDEEALGGIAEGDEDEDSDEDGDYMPCDEEEDDDTIDGDDEEDMDEEGEPSMPDIIKTVMTGVLRQYREANSRDPTPDEMTNIKSAIAAQFQIDVAQVDAAMNDS